jgi:hypothetical protein
LFAVFSSGVTVAAVAITLYVPGSTGALSIVDIVPDVPPTSVPRVIRVACETVPPADSEIVTITDSAVAVPRLLTVTCSGVVKPPVTVAASR